MPRVTRNLTEAFRIADGQNTLADYEWRGRTGRFRFCSRRGIFVLLTGDLPQLGGAYVSVNVNCPDDIDPAPLKVVYWGGRLDNWAAGPRDAPWPVHDPAT